jgi:hypothetical protein
MTNALIEEHDRAHRERQARAAAVAGAKSTDEAYRLGAAHVAADQAASDNATAYNRGVMDARKPALAPITLEQAEARAAARIAAKAARRGVAKAAAKAPAAVAALAAATPKAKERAAKVPTLTAGHGDIALRAAAYVREQAKLGKHVTATDAVAHVSRSI